MFFSKKLDDPKHNVGSSDFRDEVVTCEVCGCLVLKYACYTVRVKDMLPMLYRTTCDSSDIYYCKAHTPNYTEIKRYGRAGQSYYRKMEVDEKGEPVGYVKSNVKNSK